jgi:L-alanine-DL-glutamate epimerase-like enolase superfamily enzyme
MMSCLSGIDIACLDAIGKMLGLPIVKLLGGPARDPLPDLRFWGILHRDARERLS